MTRSIALALAASAAFVALGGCALRPQLTRVAIDHNGLVADSEDELTLLNIVRAKERFPMHFTTITALRGNATLTAGGEFAVGLPAGGGETVFDKEGKLASSKSTIGANTVTPRLTGSISTAPAFDVGVLNTEKFQRGIQQPIKTEIIEYFLQQGWPDDLLMALLIERIDVVATKDAGPWKKDDIVFRMVNSNLRPDAYTNENDEARAWLRFLYSRRMTSRIKTKDFINLVPLDRVLINSRIQDLSVLDGKALELGTTDKVVYVRRPGTESAAIRFIKRGWANPSGPTQGCKGQAFPADQGQPEKSAGQYDFLLSTQDGSSLEMEPANMDPETRTASGSDFDYLPVRVRTAGTDVEASLRPVPRSVQGVLYFLGEYSRTADGKPDWRYPLPSGRCLFDLREGSAGTTRAAISARFRGEQYFIPDAVGDGGISLQVIDLVQQLLNLHKSADDLPFTRTVTVVP